MSDRRINWAEEVKRPNRITMSAVEEIPVACSRLVRNDPTLTVLNLNHGGIGNVGLRQLASSIHCDSPLVVLFLNGNDLTDDGTVALAHSLQTSSRDCKALLKHLYMSNNAIGLRGARAISLMLRESGCALQVLKLSDNHIGAAGAHALGQVLAFNSSLRVLILQNNGIKDAGASSLALGLQSNTTLQQLDLRSNGVSAQVEETSFVPLLQLHNKTLCELCFDKHVNNKTAPLLEVLLQLNRVGRYHFGDIGVPQTAWPRVLGHAATKSNTANSLIYAALQARPDLAAGRTVPDNLIKE